MKVKLGSLETGLVVVSVLFALLTALAVTRAPVQLIGELEIESLLWLLWATVRTAHSSQ